MLIEDFQHEPNLKQAQSSLEQFLAAVQEEQSQRAEKADVPLSAVNASGSTHF